MLPTLIRRAATQAKAAGPKPPHWRVLVAMYPPKKVWPPDLRKLTPQEQLRYEKKYKRRVRLATARPKFIKMTKLAQLFAITFCVVYIVLFMDLSTEGPEGQPFDSLRRWFWEFMGYEYVSQKPAGGRAKRYDPIKPFDSVH